MALNITGLITKDEFRQKLKNKDGDFQNRIFDFAITRNLLQEAVGLAKDGNIHFNFDLNFADSEFQKIVGSDDIPYMDVGPKVIFSGKVNFEGAIFLGEARFFKATFLGEADFWNAIFSEEVSFYEATFSKEAYFYDATFSGEAKFDWATFSGEAKFDGATFSGEADFSKATFSDIANFGKARFSGEAKFDWATFSKEVNFEGARFLGEAKFFGAIFSDIANFGKARFSGKAKFDVATFSDIANFYQAIFSGEAKFYGARFSKEACFHTATFKGKAKFIGATVLDKISFSQAIFSDKVTFHAATFSDIANFYQAIFSGEAKFDGATFSGMASFSHAIFSDKVTFHAATFSQDHHTYFCNLNLKHKDNPDKRNEKETYPAPRLQFRDTIFPQLVLFSNCNLSQTTFEKCTIAGIKFRSCEFAKTGFFIFKRNAFENRTRQKSFIEKEIKEIEKNNEKLQQQTQDKIQKLETSPLKLTKIIQFPKQIFQKKTKNKTQSTKIINFQKKKQATKELKKISLKLAKLNKKLHSIELETEEKRKDREDLCCQMKTALESSKEWKQAGDFYIGELEARRSKNWWEYLKLTSFKYLLGYAERISILIIWIIAIPFIAYCFIQDLSETLKITILPLALTLDLQDKDLLILVVIFFRLLSWLFWITLAVAIRRRFRF